MTSGATRLRANCSGDENMPQHDSVFLKTQRRINGWRIAACWLICAAAWL